MSLGLFCLLPLVLLVLVLLLLLLLAMGVRRGRELAASVQRRALWVVQPALGRRRRT